MKRLLAFSFFILLLIGCKKDIDNGPLAPAELQDDIYYVDLENSVHMRYWYSTEVESCCDGMFSFLHLLPEDTIYHYELDVNQDSINDLKLSVSNFFNPETGKGNGGPDPYGDYGWSFSTVLRGLGETQVASLQDFSLDFLPEGEVINESIDYGEYRIIESYFCFNWEKSLINPGYIPFRIEKEGDYYYGWLYINTSNYNSVKLLSFAINRTKNMDINAGQTE